MNNSYQGGCAYQCNFHKGKVEWHHPIEKDTFVGLYLCEAHHSILQGRKKIYPGELELDKSLGEIRSELVLLQNSTVIAAGYDINDIDKH